MRTLYVLFILAVILSIALLAASFLYIEKKSHQTYYYVVAASGSERGSFVIDKYSTENSVIYKSRGEAPYEMAFNSKETRIELDKKDLSLKLYEDEAEGLGIKQLLYLANINDALLFLAVAKSKFACLSDMKAGKDAIFFDRMNLVTYMPFIASYNFRIGGAQSFNALKYDVMLMPPSKYTITLTSIKDELMSIDGKKVKSEVLHLRALGAEQIIIWVDRKNHNILAVEMADSKIYIKKTSGVRPIEAADYFIKDPEVLNHNISFFAGEREINGTLSRPRAKGVYPAVILFQGEDAINRGNYGLFTDLAHKLAKSGFAVLRFDFTERRGRAKFKDLSIKEEHEALSAGTEFLSSFRFVDPEKIALVAHSDANYIVPSFLKKSGGISAWVMLSPRPLVPLVNTELENIKNFLREAEKSDKNYAGILAACEQRTLAIAEENRKERASIMGVKVYLERIREILGLGPFFDDIKALTVPIAALQGKKDAAALTKFSQDLAAYLKDNKQANSAMIFFRNLDSYLGEFVKSPSFKDHYEIDNEVFQSLTTWLNDALSKNIKQPLSPDLTNQ